MEDVAAIYKQRFQSTGLGERRRVWKLLCRKFFDGLVRPTDTVLDMACGYGEFINNVNCKKRYAVDLNEDAPQYLSSDVTYANSEATDLSVAPEAGVDVVFTSNFLEHLRSKDECTSVFHEVKRILRPGGQFIVMGPNIHYAYREYWDFYDHHLALSHLSLSEGLSMAGYEIKKVIPRFLPYTMAGKKPAPDFVISAYLSMPMFWPLFGKQFLVVASKPN